MVIDSKYLRLFPQVQKQQESHIEKVAATAGRIENADLRKLFHPAEHLVFQLGAQLGAGTSAGGLHGRGDLFGSGLHRIPALTQRRHDHRFQNQQDVFAIGVVGAKLGALAIVQDALEERAEDSRLDAAPIELGRLAENRQILRFEVKDRVIGEEPAIEMPDAERPIVVAGLRHGLEEIGQLACELARRALLAIGLDHLPKEVVREQRNAIGEQAEENPHEEAGNLLGVSAAGGKVVLQIDEFPGRILGNTNLEGAGLELVRFGKDRAENIERGEVRAGNGPPLHQVIERESVDQRAGIREVRVNLEAEKVADHQQGRIVEILAVLEQL